MSAKQTVDDAIANHKIVIFSKTWCPYCKKAKTLLTSTFAKDQIYIKELDETTNEEEIQQYLAEKTKQRTVPNIFIDKKHIGGYSDLEKLRTQGKLVNASA